MIERKIKMEKDNVVKDIPENLVPDYSFMGWSKVEEKHYEEPSRYERKSYKRD